MSGACESIAYTRITGILEYWDAGFGLACTSVRSPQTLSVFIPGNKYLLARAILKLSNLILKHKLWSGTDMYAGVLLFSKSNELFFGYFDPQTLY